MAAVANHLITAALPQGEDIPDGPSRPGAFTASDVAAVVGSAASAFALVWLVYYKLMPVADAGVAGFCVCWFVAFLALYWYVTFELDGRVMAGDRLMAALMASAAVALVVPLTLILGDVLVRGIHAFTVHVFTRTQQYAGPLSPATTGGATTRSSARSSRSAWRCSCRCPWASPPPCSSTRSADRLRPAGPSDRRRDARRCRRSSPACSSTRSTSSA